MSKALVVDDEKSIVKGLKFSLEQDGYEVNVAYDGEEAVRLAKENEYEFILLDVMLPKLGGKEVCQAIREFSEVPIIMLSAKADHMDRILGLEYGADDYVTKPFNILEVKARIKAILRRGRSGKKEETQENLVVAGALRLDLENRRVFVLGKEINLTAKEFDILEHLATNPNKVYSRDALLATIWGNKQGDSSDARTVDVHVRRLREKIEPKPSEPQFVHTKWGVGYYFKG